jgi:hypothetical protein
VKALEQLTIRLAGVDDPDFVTPVVAEPREFPMEFGGSDAA